MHIYHNGILVECTSHSCHTGPYIGHIASANPGSSGSPMLREHNNKWMVVGLHRGAILEDINVATHIDLIVDDIQGKLYTGSGMWNATTMCAPLHGPLCVAVNSVCTTAWVTVCHSEQCVHHCMGHCVSQ